ncbi:MAG: RdgB/HAM1 family non-canonical purine NTP pyrophosphatase [Burkholderiales bacterium]
MNKLVVASGNAGKLREIQAILAPLNIQIVPQAELNIPEADETHFTFLENALAKARHASKLSDLPALADDSGICVDALSGAPGVYSARYAGEPKCDVRNNNKLLAELNAFNDRRAHYYCVMAVVRRHDDPEPLIAEGAWYGEILCAPRGDSGFGYDPLFLIPELGLTGGELAADVKNKISHRAKALAALVEKLQNM